MWGQLPGLPDFQKMQKISIFKKMCPGNLAMVVGLSFCSNFI